MPKLYRVKLAVPPSASNPRRIQNYTDWYEADTEAEAKAIHAEDMHRYGLPDNCAVEIVECDPVTLKPIPGSAPGKTLDSTCAS